MAEILQSQQDLQHGFSHLLAFIINRELEKFEELGEEQAHLVIIIVDEAQNSEEGGSTNLQVNILARVLLHNLNAR